LMITLTDQGIWRIDGILTRMMYLLSTKITSFLG
jgi:hypothetical protein